VVPAKETNLQNGPSFHTNWSTNRPYWSGSLFMTTPMVLLPRDKTAPCSKTSWCRWCVHTGPLKTFFKVRDGPVDWHFCNVVHAELWLEYRHKKETYQLLRTLPPERLEYLNGRSMEDIISGLFPERCDPKMPSPP
jgi:hypothetical protein